MRSPSLSARIQDLVAGRPDRAELLREFGLSLEERVTVREACRARGISPDSVAFALWALERVREMKATVAEQAAL